MGCKTDLVVSIDNVVCTELLRILHPVGRMREGPRFHAERFRKEDGVVPWATDANDAPRPFVRTGEQMVSSSHNM